MYKHFIKFISLFLLVQLNGFSQKITKGVCSDMVYYQFEDDRIFLNNRDDSLLGVFFANGELDFKKCLECETCHRICNYKLSDSESEKVNRDFLCSSQGRTATIHDVKIINITKNRRSYEVSLICCNRDVEIAFFLLVFKERGKCRKCKIVDFHWLRSEIQI